MTERSNTVTVHLMGGLGNQLFQYAFGRRLAYPNHAELHLDASGYGSSSDADPAKGVRTCELAGFNIVGTIEGQKSGTPPARRSSPRLWSEARHVVDRVIDLRKPYYARREIVEPPSNYSRFDARVLHRVIQGPVSARGFWQSEKYFIEIEGQIRRELTLRCQPDSSSQRLADQIMSSNSVGVHVRHGDNASRVAPLLGVLSPEYYGRALETLSAELERPSLFVFSDDIPWAKQLLGTMVSTRYVEHQGAARSEIDLWLMSLCRHHVLANSTFGWWGAWLARKPGQIVYAPRRYYQNIDRPNPDLYPPDWRLI